MGVIQQGINQTIQTAAKLSAVVGTGEAVGEIEGLKMGQEELKNAVTIAKLDDEGVPVLDEDVNRANSYLDIVKEELAKKGINGGIEIEDFALSGKIPAGVDEIAFKKALANTYYRKMGKGRLQLGVEAVRNRLIEIPRGDKDGK